MLMLFPALVVLTALLAQVPEGTTLVGEIRASFEQFLPADSMSLLQSTMQARRIHSAQLIFSAASLSRLCRPGPDALADGGLSPRLPSSARRLGILAAAAPGAAAGAHRAGSARAGHSGAGLRPPDRGVDDRQRRPRAAACCALLLADGALGDRAGHQRQRPRRPLSLRHAGAKSTGPGWCRAPWPPRWSGSRPRWPSAGMSPGSPTTRMFYGSFGAGIATLVWLYITSFSALLGAELNGVLFRERQERTSASASSDPDLSVCDSFHRPSRLRLPHNE